jgi:hypothetical protein
MSTGRVGSIARAGALQLPPGVVMSIAIVSMVLV